MHILKVSAVVQMDEYRHIHTYINKYIHNMCGRKSVCVCANLNPGDSGDAQQGLCDRDCVRIIRNSLRRLPIVEQREGSRGGRTGQQLHLVNLT